MNFVAHIQSRWWARSVDAYILLTSLPVVQAQTRTQTGFHAKVEANFCVKYTALATSIDQGMGQQHLIIIINDPVRGPHAQKSIVTVSNRHLNQWQWYS